MEEIILKKVKDVNQVVKDVNQVYNAVMEHSFKLQNSPTIVFDNLHDQFLSTYFESELFGEGWSTAIFGQDCRINFYTTWGVISADIKYLVCKT